MAENGEIAAGWGRFSLAAKGPLVIILISLYAGIALNVWFMSAAEEVRRVVEQEARLEVSTLKASQAVIMQSIARYCAVPGLEIEVERIEAEYKQRREYINRIRERLGVTRIGPSEPAAPQQYQQR